MATYKVIQDIEAEDHILGPLTLRQFIYGLITAFCLYMSFISVVKHVGLLLIVFLPPALFCGFFTFPFGKDQPTEVWALAKIRFLFMPRRRIWNQSGVKELVTVTAPKKIEISRTNGLSQTEVKSRLQALADTIDSRGWAIKNVGADAYNQSSRFGVNDSDRLIDPLSMPRPVPDYDVQASDDILDESSNPVAQQFATMITSSTEAHRQQLIEELSNVRAQHAVAGQATPSWFAAPAITAASPPATDQMTDEAALTSRLQQQAASQQLATGHLRNLQPHDDQQNSGVSTPSQPVTAPPDPAILKLANNNDLNVATLAREAKKAKDSDGPEDEVVIALR